MSMGVMCLILGGVWLFTALAAIGIIRGGSDNVRRSH